MKVNSGIGIFEVKVGGEGEQWKILVIVKVAFTLGVLIEL